VTGRAAAQAAYERQCARDAAAWQPPHVLIECLRRLIAAVDRHPEVIADIADGLWHADRRYFADGHWRADLATMLRCLE
jgi:hypothetical protein